MPYQKSPSKKPVAKKSVAKTAHTKSPVKKSPVKKSPVKKSPAKKSSSGKAKLNVYAKFVKKHYHDSKLEKLSPTDKFVKLGKMWSSLKKQVCAK
jgi:hypothetical protein